MSNNYVCPWWAGYFLINPLRKFSQNPEKILKNYVKSGCHVLEIGPGMGFFTLTAAELAGTGGRVFSVDIQHKMLDKLKKRAAKKNLQDRIDCRLCTRDSFCIDDLAGRIDFCLLMYVVHELPSPERLFAELSPVIKKDGIILFTEPKGHVSTEAFERNLELAVKAGFHITGTPDFTKALTAVLVKS